MGYSDDTNEKSRRFHLLHSLCASLALSRTRDFSTRGHAWFLRLRIIEAIAATNVAPSFLLTCNSNAQRFRGFDSVSRTLITQFSMIEEILTDWLSDWLDDHRHQLGSVEGRITQHLDTGLGIRQHWTWTKSLLRYLSKRIWIPFLHSKLANGLRSKLLAW